jgi:flagellar M-ring protein FliF
MTNAVSDSLTTQVSSLLDRVLGPGKSVVRVAAQLDFDQHTRQSEVYDPTHQAIASQTTSGEHYTGAAADAQGQVTTTPADTATTGTTGTTPSSRYDKSSTQTQYDVSRTVGTDTSTPGKVQRLSVAVVLDQKALGTTSTAQVQSLIAAAVGADPSRGDTVVVNTATFDTSAQQQADQAQADLAHQRSRQQTLRWIEAGIGGAVLLGAAGALVWVVRRRSRTEDWSPASLEGLSSLGPLDVMSEPVPPVLPGGFGPEVEPAHLTPLERARLRLGRQTDQIVPVLRAWMAEDAQTAH